jgi:hypothetical protein
MENGKTNRFFLNPLREDMRHLATPDRGRWKDDIGSGDFLKRFAQDIYLKGEIQDSHVSHSVPSVFARPIIFQQAMADETSPLHKLVVAEWRGLLSLVALQQYAGFNLQAVPYDVPTLSDKARSQVGTVGLDDLHLRTILRNQLPQKENDWSRWWMLYCDGALVGATSPWTIVYTPARYVCPASIPWKENRQLCDPIKFWDPRGNGRSHVLGLLLRWVELMLRSKDTEWGMPDHLEEHFNIVAREMGAWRNDLARYADNAIQVKAFTEIKLIDESPYDSLLRTGDIPKGDASDLLLESTKLKDRSVVALAASKISRTDRVYGAVTADLLDLDDIKSRGLAGNSFRTKTGVEVKLEYVFVEDAFFPSKLMALPLDAQAMTSGTTDFALPLTPAFFKYFDHADLKERRVILNVAPNEKTVVATLRLPLQNGQRMTIERIYDRSMDTFEAKVVPALAMWPDFYSDDWEENYAAYVANVEHDAEDIRVAPLQADGTSYDVEAVIGDNQKPLRLWRCPRGAIGFAIRYRAKGDSVVEQAGVALRAALRNPLPISDQNIWRVGVDFGTSSTNVTVRKNDHPVELLPVVSRLQYLTKAYPDSLALIAENLYPDHTETPPFPTLLYDSQATYIGATANYTLRFQFNPVERKPPLPNVKWGKGPASSEERPLKAYLRGIVRYIAAEARDAGVGKLLLNWSYPLSLPQEALQPMKDFWTTVASTYSRQAAMAAAASTYGTSQARVQTPAPSGLMEVDVVETVSESEAVCRCLAALSALDVHAGSLTVAVDVGGGSTDVGFWSSKKLEDQFSFKLAGSDILNTRWLEFPDFLTTFYQACAGAAMPGKERENIEQRATAYMNNLLQFARDTSGERYTGVDPRRHPLPKAILGGPAGEAPWLHIRSLAYLFFAGVAYYIGIHARKFKPQVPEMKVYFGGRGAGFLTWISADAEKAIDVLKEFVKAGLDHGKVKPADAPKAPELSIDLLGPPLRFSPSLPQLKHEVALGLQADKLEGSIVEKKAETLIGETGWRIGDTEKSWDDKVDVAQLGGLNLPKGNDFSASYLAFFKTLLPKHPELSLDVEGFKKLSILPAQIEDCVRKSGGKDEQVLQPVFACELKSLMTQYMDYALKLRPLN